MPGGRHHVAEAERRQHPAVAPYELAGGEVAVARGHVVEPDAGDVAVGVDEHDADGLVAVQHHEGVVALGDRGPGRVGLVAPDVVAVDREQVSQVGVVTADLDHLEGGVVVPVAQQT